MEKYLWEELIRDFEGIRKALLRGDYHLEEEDFTLQEEDLYRELVDVRSRYLQMLAEVVLQENEEAFEELAQ